MAGKILISAADEAAIKNAVANAEKASALEIVPIVMATCDSYPAVFWRMAITLNFLIGGFLVFCHAHLDPLWILSLQSLGLPLAFLLRHSGFASRLFLDDYDSHTEVHERAVVAFHEMGIHRTKARTGVLIFVALFERRVEVICDVGISAKIAATEWNQITEKLSKEIGLGRLGPGLANAIIAAGELVRPQFPASPDDVNELGNELVHK